MKAQPIDNCPVCEIPVRWVLHDGLNSYDCSNKACPITFSERIWFPKNTKDFAFKAGHGVLHYYSFDVGKYHLPGNRTYTLVIDYPFSKVATYSFKTKKGMGLIGLLRLITKCYERKYKAAERDDDDGYWHGIGDLVIEGITVDHKKKKITLDIGS